MSGPYDIIDWDDWTARGDRSLDAKVSFRGTVEKRWRAGRTRKPTIVVEWRVIRPDGTEMPGRFTTLKAASAARIAEHRAALTKLSE